MARFWDVIDFKIWFETYLDMAGFWDVIDFRIWFGTCLDTTRFWDVIDFRIWFGTYLDMAGFCNVADLRTLFGDLDTKTKWVAKPRGVCFFFSLFRSFVPFLSPLLLWGYSCYIVALWTTGMQRTCA